MKNDNNTQAGIYDSWSIIKENAGDYKSSLLYHKKYTDYLINMITETKAAALLDIQRKYRFEQLKNENITFDVAKATNIAAFIFGDYYSLGRILVLLSKIHVKQKK